MQSSLCFKGLNCISHSGIPYTIHSQQTRHTLNLQLQLNLQVH